MWTHDPPPIPASSFLPIQLITWPAKISNCNFYSLPWFSLPDLPYLITHQWYQFSLKKKNPPHLRGATFFVQTHVISCLPCCNILLSKSMPFSLLFLCLNHPFILLLKDRLSLAPHSRVPFVKGLGQSNGSGDWQESGQMGMGIYQECSENHIPWGTSTGTEIRSCNV